MGVPLAVLLSGFSIAANAAGTSTIPIDPVFGLPIPPIDTFYSATNTLHAGIAWTIGGLIVVCISCFHAAKRKSLLPIFVALSGLLCVVPEVFVDIAGDCFYAIGPHNPNVVFSIWGREMTWYTVAAWFSFGAVLIYINYYLISKGVKTKWLWGAFLIAGAVDVLFEELLLRVPGVYLYYGNQPFIVFQKFPVWWMFTNSAGLFLAASLAYRYEKYLRGWKAVSILFLTPTAYLAVFGFSAMPASIVINGNYSWLATQTGGLISVILALIAVALTMHLVLQRDPFCREALAQSEIA